MAINKIHNSNNLEVNKHLYLKGKLSHVCNTNSLQMHLLVPMMIIHVTRLHYLFCSSTFLAR